MRRRIHFQRRHGLGIFSSASSRALVATVDAPSTFGFLTNTGSTVSVRRTRTGFGLKRKSGAKRDGPGTRLEQRR